MHSALNSQGQADPHRLHPATIEEQGNREGREGSEQPYDAAIRSPAFTEGIERSSRAGDYIYPQSQTDTSQSYTQDRSAEAGTSQDYIAVDISALPDTASTDTADTASPSISKRTLQNRRAQREFRQRRASYLKDLEQRVRQYESGAGSESTSELRASVARLTQENDHLRITVGRLQVELAEARRELQTSSGASGVSSAAPFPLQEEHYTPALLPPVQQRPHSTQPELGARSQLYHTSSAHHLRYATPLVYDPIYESPTGWNPGMQQLSDVEHIGFRRTSHSTPISPIDANPSLPLRNAIAPRPSISAQSDSSSTSSTAIGHVQAPSNLRSAHRPGQPPISPSIYGWSPLGPRTQMPIQEGLPEPLFPPEAEDYTQIYPALPQTQISFQQHTYSHEPHSQYSPQPPPAHHYVQDGTQYEVSPSTYTGVSTFPGYTHAGIYEPAPTLQICTGHLEQSVTSRTHTPTLSPTTFTAQVSLSEARQSDTRSTY